MTAPENGFFETVNVEASPALTRQERLQAFRQVGFGGCVLDRLPADAAELLRQDLAALSESRDRSIRRLWNAVPYE